MHAESENRRATKPRHVAPVTPEIHPDALVKLPQIIGLNGAPPLLACGRTRFYELVAEGKLPKPRKLGHSSFWRAGVLISTSK